MVYFIVFISVFAAFVLGVLAVIGYRKAKIKALSTLEYDREFNSDGIFVGETLELIETVCNPGWFPLFAVKMEFYVPAGLVIDGFECKEYTKLTSVFNIPPFSTVQKKHTVRVDKRGRFYLEDSSFSYRKSAYIFDIPIEFYGYPDYFNAQTEMPAFICQTGTALSNRKYIEDPFFLSGIREYRFGDPQKSINFKASSKAMSGGMRRMMCNSYDSSRNYDTMIFLDLNTYAEVQSYDGAMLEAGLKYACYLFCETLKNAGRVGFSSNFAEGGQKFFFIPCESGEIHVKRILERFAVLDSYTKRDYSMAALLRLYTPNLRNETDIYLITPFVDENTAETLSLLKSAGRNVNVINIGGGVRL